MHVTPAARTSAALASARLAHTRAPAAGARFNAGAGPAPAKRRALNSGIYGGSGGGRGCRITEVGGDDDDGGGVGAYNEYDDDGAYGGGAGMGGGGSDPFGGPPPLYFDDADDASDRREAERVAQCQQMLDDGVPVSPTMREARRFVKSHSLALRQAAEAAATTTTSPAPSLLAPRVVGAGVLTSTTTPLPPTTTTTTTTTTTATAAAAMSATTTTTTAVPAAAAAAATMYSASYAGSAPAQAHAHAQAQAVHVHVHAHAHAHSGGGVNVGGGQFSDYDGEEDGGGSASADGADAPERPQWAEQRHAAAAAAIGDAPDKVRRAALKRDYARLVGRAATAAEEDFQIDNDEECLRWKPVKPPRQQETDRVLGEPQPRAECWGCAHGDRNMSQVSSNALAKMTDLFVKNRFEMNRDALGVVLAAFYEAQLRAPTLDPRRRRNNEAALPEWNAASIIAHFFDHRQEPQAKIEKRIEQHGELADHLITHCVYRAPVGASDTPAPREVRVNNAALRNFLAVTSSERAWYTLSAKTMNGYNGDFKLEHEARQLVRTKYNQVGEIRKRTLFDGDAPAPP